MSKIIQLRQPREALEFFLEVFSQPVLEKEQVLTKDALDRIIAVSISSPYALPSFERSSMDGYAVKAKNTLGASDSSPAYLHLIGEVKMGEVPALTVADNQCALIHTGGMIPVGADAVVPLEYTKQGNNYQKNIFIEIQKAVAVSENILHIGEDVKQGEEWLLIGKRIRTAEIGGLMALGITKIPVFRQLKVGIISTGDEVVSPEAELKLGQVRDVNTYILSSIVLKRNHIPISYGICTDDEKSLIKIVKQVHQECDIVVIAAGSSASVKDLTSEVINQVGKPGVIIHGLNIKPGKPTILAVCNNKPIIGLPGNPVSAFVIATLFLNPIMDKCSGCSNPEIFLTYKGKLAMNILPHSGREEWHPMMIKQALEDSVLVEPIYYKSNLIFSLSRADGLLKIPSESNELSIGAEVDFIRI